MIDHLLLTTKCGKRNLSNLPKYTHNRIKKIQQKGEHKLVVDKVTDNNEHETAVFHSD